MSLPSTVHAPYNALDTHYATLSVSEANALRALHSSFPLNVFPNAMKPFAELTLIHHPSGILLFSLPSLYGIFLAASLSPTPQQPILRITLHFLTLSILMRSTLCTWHEILDRDHDRHDARTRIHPLARHALSTRAALLWAVAQTCATGAALALLPHPCLPYTLCSLAFRIAHPLLTRHTSFPAVILGHALASGALPAFPALGRSLGLLALYALPPDLTADSFRIAATAICLAGLVFEHTMFIDEIHTAQDAAIDTAARRGASAPTRATLRLYVFGQLSALVAICMALLLGAAPSAGVVFGVSGCVFAGAGVFAMAECVNLNSAASCAWWFKVGNLWVGPSLVAAFVGQYFCVRRAL